MNQTTILPFVQPAVRMGCLLYVAAAFFPALSPALALQVTRGPYLQSGTPTNIVVRWRTDLATNSRVQFGLSAAALEWEAAGTNLTMQHIVTLTNLAPDTRYFYAVGTSEGNLAGGTNYCFATSPAGPKPVRIWAIGDSGTASQGWGYAQTGVRDAYYNFTASRPTDVWLMLGDNAYYYGTDQEYQINVFNIYPTLLRQNVVWPTIGNHDASYGLSSAYFQIFSLPTQGQAGGVASGTDKYYSFDYANIHFVCLDSEFSSRAAGSTMLTWLESDLAANTNAWLIAYWHRPPYSMGSHHSDYEGPMIQMRENVVPILESYGLDLMLSGHSHSYERSYLLDGHYGYTWNLDPSMIKDSGSGREDDTGAYLKPGTGPSPRQGAVYVVAGSSGWVSPMHGEHPVMFASLAELGSLVIDVNGDRMDVRFLRETGAIDDYFTILKGAPAASLRIARYRIRDGEIRMQWKSVAGQSYRVESNPNVDATENWEPASADMVASGATSGWTNSLPPGGERLFYRVKEIPGAKKR